MTDDERPGPAEGERTTDRDDDRPATDRDDDRPATDRDDDRPATQPMTDTDDDTTEPGEPIATAGSTDDGIGRLPTERLRGVLDRVGLAALVLLALIAGWGFYSQTGVAIRTWLDAAYQPIALAAFNLAILLIALAGVAHQLSRIRANE